MASEDEDRFTQTPAPTADTRRESPAEDGGRKRKTSARDPDNSTAKRPKQGRDGTPPRSTSSDRRPESRDTKRSFDQGRMPALATDEEKQRTKRLFGGLLNTLSQKTGDSQQRRRQEIERRQRDKMQLQSAEEDKKRAEKRAALHGIRMEQQIVWEEQVMRNRHAKMLKSAQFLQTRSMPKLHYRPRRLGRREEDMIEDQVRDCKAIISRELEEFQGRKERQAKRHGPRLSSSTVPIPEMAWPAQLDEAPAPERSPTTRATDDGDNKTAPRAHDLHDDSGDVLVEADEDTVIY